jgi:hypothetical protein
MNGDGGVLDQMAMGFAPMATNAPPRMMTGLEGMPYLAQHPLMAMLASPFVMQAMGQAGMMPMGLGHDQNVYDVLRQRQFFSQQRQAMANVSYLERENLMRAARGVFAMAGQPFGAEQRRFANVFAGGGAMAAPIIAQMAPDFLEAMGGMRGSPTVMASRMMAAGRYQLDPVTGQMGYSPESMGRVAGQVFQDLYGTRRDVMQMHGVTAGQAGAMYEQLVMRGMVGTEPGTFQERARRALGGMSEQDLQRAAGNRNVVIPTGGVGKLTAQDVESLTLDPDVANKLRSFDADKIKRAIKGYSGAVAAIRDIFGDMGRPNAPMGQLMQSLEAMTMGQLSQMDPDRAGRMVRQTYNLARSTGVGLDNAMILQQHAAARGAGLGLDPIFGVQAAQGAMAFGGAYAAAGHGAHPAWGAMNVDELRQADANLRQGAAASNAANRLAVIMRLAETHGGFQRGGEAANIVAAVRGGQTQYVGAGGQVQQLGSMQPADFYRILTGARGAGGQALGITEADLREMMTQDFANREAKARYPIPNVVRDMMGPAQVTPFLANRLRETLTQRLQGEGMDRATAANATEQVSRTMMDRIMSMSRADFADPTRRRERMADVIGEELGGTAAGAVLGRMGADRRQAFLRQSADVFYGQGSEALQAFAGLNMQTAHQLFDPQVLAQTNARQQRAAFEGRLQEVLTPLGQGTPLRRLMDALQQARPGDSLTDLIGPALGGVKTADVNRQIAGPMQELNQKVNRIKEMHAQIQRAPAGRARDDLLAQLESLEKEARNQAAAVSKTAGDFGIFAGGNITARDTGAAIDVSRALGRQIVDVGNISGGFGTEVDMTGKEAQQALIEYGEGVGGRDPSKHTGTAGKGRRRLPSGLLTGDALPWEARAVLVARRRRQMAGPIPEMEMDAEVARLRQQNPGLGLQEAQAQATRNVRAWQEANLQNISPQELAEEMETGRLQGDDERRALVLARREHVDPRANAEQRRAALVELRRTDPSATEAQGAQLADARQRAKRWGISQDEIATVRAGKQGRTEMEAIDVAVAAREAAQFDVSDAEIADAKKRDPAVASKSDADVKRGILDKRAKEQSARFERFWASDDGARLRENVELQAAHAETTAERLIQSPDVARRFGTQAIDMAAKLQDIAQRRKILAFRYTGGNVARLMVGDWVNRPKDAAEYQKVREDMMAMHAAELDVHERLRETHGAAGRQFRRGTRAEALASAGAAAVTETGLRGLHARWRAAGSPTGEEFTYQGRAEKYTMAQYEQLITDERSRLGDAEEAARLMGMSADEVKALLAKPDAQLSPEERKKKAEFNAKRTDVSIARRLTGEDEEKIRAFTERDAAIDRLAQQQGVTKEQLINVVVRGQAGPARLSLLTDEEKGRRDVALEGRNQALAEQRNAEAVARQAAATVKNLDESLARTGPGKQRDSLTKYRADAQRQLEGARRDVAAATNKAAGFVSQVEGDARRRGVGGTEYLEGKGFLTEGVRGRVLDEHKRMAQGLRELEAIAGPLGMRPEDLGSVVKNVVEPQLRMAEEARLRAGQGGMAALQEMAPAFGLPAVTADDRRAQEVADKISSMEGGAKWAEYMVGTEKLIAREGTGMGPAVLSRRWQDAMKMRTAKDRDTALEQLQVDLGIKVSDPAGKRRWDRLTEALDFQKQAGLLERKDGKLSMDQIAKAFDAVRQSGDMRGPPQPGGQGGRQEIFGRLDLYMKDGKADINARTGGALGNSAGPS